MADFGIYRGFSEKLFEGQTPTDVGVIGVRDVSAFVFTVDTTQSGTSASDQFILPLTTSTGLDCIVYWGDGTNDRITDHTAPEVTHTYPSGGTYTIRIGGSLLGWQFNSGGDRLKMGEIQKWAGLNISVNRGFYGCTNMTCTATDVPLITISDLTRYFEGCTNFNGEIGNWDVSSVTSMFRMFRICTNFNGDIGNWDVSNVISMSSAIFGATSFNQDVGNWDVSSVTDMQNMFENADSFNQDISSWDINQVTSFLGFMRLATGLSTTNYDALLIGWEAQAPTSGININFGGSTYTAGSAAATARQSLIDNYNWTITDGGTA